jgi:hypothetical protein
MVGVNQGVNRTEAVRCTRCDAPALDDSEFCEHHRKIRRAAFALSRKKTRARNRRARLCADCPNPSKTYRCAICTMKNKRPPKRVNRSVNRREAGTKLEVGKDGATRTRVVFRAGQGGQSKEEIQRGHLRLFADAARLDAVFEGHYPSMVPVVDEMPRIQRAEGKAQLASPLVRGARLRLQVAEEIDPSLRGTCGACGRAHATE